MRITSVTSTELFVGDPRRPRQVVRVAVDGAGGPPRVEVTGDGVTGSAPSDDAAAGSSATGSAATGSVSGGEPGPAGPGEWCIEVGVVCAQPPGTRVPIEVSVWDAGERASTRAELVVAEPGWTVWMVPHFHYDPVWWATQAAYTATWAEPGQAGAEFRLDFQQAGFELVRTHLETARRDPEYKFVLAELDYLKPYWDARPQERAYLRRLIGEGRVELLGGTYNEPNTNLTSAESTVRNLAYGAGFQRELLGGDPRTAWQLDVFGHDPQFPGLVADAGMDSSSWARGPFHQWGPMLSGGAPIDTGWSDPSGMQFPSEFEWLSPSGRGVLTHYMPAHYSAGWWSDAQPTLGAAEEGVYELFLLLKRVAATRNVLLPVGTDYTPPARWVTDIHRDWNARYAWPRFVCGLPKEFFAAVRAQLAESGRVPVPQTRDMNPIYTGKDVSFVDTKQAQRYAEALLVDAEKFATIAATLGAGYPHAALDKAWRLLVFGAHHDAITGSESDQVYLDLLTGWRQAYDLARGVLDAALGRLTPAPAGPARGDSLSSGAAAAPEWQLMVFNPSSWARSGLVRCRVELPVPGFHGVSVQGSVPASPTGDAVPASPARGAVPAEPAGGAGPAGIPVLLEHCAYHPDGSLAAADVVFRADGVPSLGYRAWRLVARTEPAEGWREVDALAIENQTYRLVVDPACGGAVASLDDLRTGRALLRPGQVGNELLIYDEYPAHPRFHEGPWHLLPKGGPIAGSAQAPAESVRVRRSPLGERVTVTGTIGPLRYTQELTLWHGIDRIDAVTRIDEFTGADHLVRLRWPVEVPGALPVSEVGGAVVGRGFGLIDVDSDAAPWTLDNPAQNWFGLSAAARVELVDPDGAHLHTRAIGIAEIIAGAGPVAGEPAGLAAGSSSGPFTGAGPAVDAVARAVRDLAVALVRQGVTATCSTDTGSRYGNLAVDSNLPDVRIAVGGPDANAFTARVLAAADPAYAHLVAEQLAATGRARVWVPASRPLAEVWVPGADLTDPRALPVLVIAGEQELAGVCAEVEAGDPVRVTQPANLTTPVDPELDEYTFGLVNRGVPGFAVDATGALHLSLLRSCTGWPSGVWADAPRRTAPDGSNFQQQHWSHGFEYALVTGPGDWRAAGLVPHGHDVNHPLLTRLVPGSPVDAELGGAELGGAEPGGAASSPAARSFVSVEPSGQVVLAALKAAGHPLANGRRPGERVETVTARVYEANGRSARAKIRLWAPVTAASMGDVLDRPVAPLPLAGSDRALARSDSVDVPPAVAGVSEVIEVPLGGAAIGHLLVELATPAGSAATPGADPTAVPGGGALDPATVPDSGASAPGGGVVPGRGASVRGGALGAAAREPYQPLYARYWLQNAGPAPIGNMPLAVHVEPLYATVDAPVTVAVTIASDRTDEVCTGRVQLIAPEGWACEPAELAYELEPGGYAEHAVVVTPPEQVSAGTYWLRARIGYDGQAIEDVARLLVGAHGAERVTATAGTGRLSLHPGEAASIDLDLTSDAATPIAVQAWLISPWHTWEMLPKAIDGVEIPARGAARLSFPVVVPAGALPGRWWALVKLAHAGVLHYTEPVEIEVLPE